MVRECTNGSCYQILNENDNDPFKTQEDFNATMDDSIKGIILKAMKDDPKFRKEFIYSLLDIFTEYDITTKKS